MPVNPITVSVGGGHELDRAGLVALLASLPRFQVVSIENDPPPQVLVWDMSLDKTELPLIEPRTKLLLLTEGTDEAFLPDTVHGLFSRDELVSALAIAIRQVARGEQYLSPKLAAAILAKRQATTLTESDKSTIDTLTEREREILDLLAKGLATK